MGYQIRLTPRDGGVLASTAEAQRILAGVVHRTCGPAGLAAFGAADNHIHALLACGREGAGRAARRLSLSLSARLAIHCGFRPTYIDPIRDSAHFRNALFYQLRQLRHHGVRSAHDPWLTSSGIPDLLGLRPSGRTVWQNVQRVLPRLGVQAVLAGMDIRAEVFDEGGWPESPPSLVVEAALAASLLPRLDSRSSRAVRVRRTVVGILAAARLPSAVMAAVLQVAPSTLRRLRQLPMDLALLNSTRRYLAFARALGCLAGHQGVQAKSG